MNNWKDLDPAYFYGRISTDTQDRTLSIGEQRKNAEVIAQREGYKFIRDFPEVKSAATDDRPVFQEMRSLATSPQRPVKAIFFNDLSRAFRDDEDFYINRRIFREAGVEVTVQTSGVELAEGLLMTAGLSVNSRYEPKNSRRSDTQIPSSLNSYAWRYSRMKKAT